MGVRLLLGQADCGRFFDDLFGLLGVLLASLELVLQQLIDKSLLSAERCKPKS